MSLVGTKSNDKELNTIVASIMKPRNISLLELSNLERLPECCDMISKLIENLPKLSSLTLNHNKLTASNLSSLNKAITNSTIKDLILKNFYSLTEEYNFVNFLQDTQNLKSLAVEFKR